MSFGSGTYTKCYSDPVDRRNSPGASHGLDVCNLYIERLRPPPDSLAHFHRAHLEPLSDDRVANCRS